MNRLEKRQLKPHWLQRRKRLAMDDSATPLVTLGNAIDVAFTPAGNIQSSNVQAALVELDNEKVAKAGDVMSGMLTLPVTVPSNGQHATNKTYVDTGDAAAAAAANNRVLKGGDTMTGPLVLPSDPTLGLQAATKQYVDGKAGGGSASITIGDTAPLTPIAGNVWWESDTGIQWIYYNDGTSSQWVQSGGVGGVGNFVSKGGDTMSGTLTLAFDPVSGMQAATKQYVDSKGGSAAGITFAPAGNISGTTVQSAVVELDNEKVAKGGDTMTGALTLPVGDPVVATSAAHKGYVDSVTSNKVLKTGDTMSGDLTISKPFPQLHLNSTDANPPVIWAEKNGLARWNIQFPFAETGANVGSDLLIRRYDDAGGLLGDLLQGNRATGQVSVSSTAGSTTPTTGALTVAGGLGVGGAINAAGQLGIVYASPTILLHSTGANSNNYIYGFRSSVPRWRIDLGDSAPESSGNVGSRFAINSYDDAGAFNGGAVTILRKDLSVSLASSTNSTSTTSGALTVAGGLGVGGAGTFGGNVAVGANPGSTPGISNTAIGNSVWTDGALISSRGAGPTQFVNTNIDGILVQYSRGGTGVGSVFVTTTTTSFNTSSDAALKEDLKSFDAGNIIDNTNVYDFKWKSTQERAYGVVAQEAYEVYPTAVTHTKAAEPDEKNNTPKRDEWWGIDYSKYVPVLLQELKTLRERVAVLEGREPAKPATTPKGRK